MKTNILKFIEFDIELYESYLSSNYAPLYHLTDKWSLARILRTNKIELGYYDMKTHIGDTKAVSLTRDETLKIKNKVFGCAIVLDSNELRNNYSIKPYDFFINQDKTKLGKIQNKERKLLDHGYEEYLDKEIIDLNNYIIRIDIFKLSDFYLLKKDFENYIEIYPSVEIFLYHENKLTKLL